MRLELGTFLLEGIVRNGRSFVYATDVFGTFIFTRNDDA
jgi:hypothetical protein